jgi:sigma-E factor negative regulatory protein RseB
MMHSSKRRAGRVDIKLNVIFKPLLVLVILMPGLLQASEKTAMEWIQSMSDAMRNLNYRGNFVYMHDNQLESMSISHMKDESGEKERLLSLNGEAREVIRDDKNLTCIWPSSRKVVVDFSRKNTYSPLFIPDDIKKISQFYDMSLIGTDRIANNSTVVVQIKPKDKYRYGVVFWIGQENGLMLKSNLINESKQVVEQVMFTSLELLKEGEPLDVNEIPPIDENFTMVRYHSGDDAESVVTETAWHLSKMPEGFHQQSVLKRLNSESGEFFHQMVYTDGLASLSVFIEKQSSQMQQGKTSMGAVNAFIRVTNEYSVTAIGEVPAVTVQTMAESVFYQQP